jgi:hypothetical protein
VHLLPSGVLHGLKADMPFRTAGAWPVIARLSVTISGFLLDPRLTRWVTSNRSHGIMCDLLVLLRHLREAVLPQALGPGAVPLRRLLLARLLRLVLGRHRLPSRGGGAGACVPSGNEAARRCPGGGRSPAPASVYTKSCPLARSVASAESRDMNAPSRAGHDAPPTGVMASPGPSVRSGGSGRFESCAGQRFASICDATRISAPVAARLRKVAWRIGPSRKTHPSLIGFYDKKIAGAMPVARRASCY